MQFAIGCRHHEEKMVDETSSLKEAVKHYTSAAEEGHADAMCNLAYCFSHGEGIAKDPSASVKLYKCDTHQNRKNAQNS